MRGNLFADLNQVVTEGSRGLGKRVERQDDGSRTDLKVVHDGFTLHSSELAKSACDECEF